ncbi:MULTISPECIES: hypothetical protein [unclassified Sphingopyxis]|uniref:hypothetical protein n=1 Tax=unclassified Sphingopyxis TaxID=2614943 RepID=UPI000736E774|nr:MULTISPECIES: hypothetical protein [unclassified Sphingopyxis]KTE34895.1 hypothetical protein ATE62_15490 [Sphingopyxis sp. HIX]KTE72007.1 hypothetical protein ATE72_22440 [Sphingopyxis sp. HXXIV]
MIRTKNLAALGMSALLLSAAPVSAQSDTQPSTEKQKVRVGDILGSLFGDRLGTSTSIEGQWAVGRKPLNTNRTQFHTRIDSDVRAGTLTQANGTRMKSEYDELVALETRYGADGRFTTAERTELGDKYGTLTQALSEGGYADTREPDTLAVADGKAEFTRRVDAQVSARRLTRTAGTRLKTDYAALITAEATYARDGISASERDDLDARLDALDARVGDTSYGSNPVVLDNKTRLANVDNALRTSGLSTSAQAQVRVEAGDLTRLDAAYARATPSSDDRAYLERRIAELEVKAKVKR